MQSLAVVGDAHVFFQGLEFKLFLIQGLKD